MGGWGVGSGRRRRRPRRLRSRRRAAETCRSSVGWGELKRGQFFRFWPVLPSLGHFNLICIPFFLFLHCGGFPRRGGLGKNEAGRLALSQSVGVGREKISETPLLGAAGTQKERQKKKLASRLLDGALTQPGGRWPGRHARGAPNPAPGRPAQAGRERRASGCRALPPSAGPSGGASGGARLLWGRLPERAS